MTRKLSLEKLAPRVRQVLQDVSRVAGERGARAYVVGGFVRDIILKRGNLDVDVVVEDDALTFSQSLSPEEINSVKLYKEFGTATVTYQDGLRLDLSTARKEIYRRPGALPEVSPGDLRDDLYRRDFSINAMAVSIDRGTFGELADPFDGWEDLKRKKVRVLHDKSFVDDPTRVLRAVRFEQRFGFFLEPSTLRLLRTAVKSGAVDSVKPERYFSEFRKVFREPSPLKGLRRLHALGGLDFLRPRYRMNTRLFGLLERNLRRLSRGELYSHLPTAGVYLMGLFEGMSAGEKEKVLVRFNLNRSERENILASGRAAEIIRRLSRKGLAASMVYETLSPLAPETIFFIRARTSDIIVGRQIDHFWSRSRHVRVSLNGDDLLRMGVPAGRSVGEILKMILLRKIDGYLATPEDEVREAIRLAGR